MLSDYICIEYSSSMDYYMYIISKNMLQCSDLSIV